MNIFEQLEKIDEYIEKRKLQEAEDILLASGMGSGTGMGFSSGGGVPWTHRTPPTLDFDFDADGIPDALDDYWGPGAFEDEF